MFDNHSAQTCDLTIVVPFYNPGPRFIDHVGEIIDVLLKLNISFEVIAVSDGSTDESEEQLAELTSNKLKIICNPINQGKGAALHTGLAVGRGDYLGFLDADGDLPAGLLVDLVEIMKSDQPDVIYGSKRHPSSNVYYPPIRRVYSWGYQLLSKILFRLTIKDSQTGIKVLRRDVITEVLPRMIEKRFAFDLELFVVARQRGFINFVEMPVVIVERFSSTVSLRSVWQMLQDTLAIFYRLRIIHFYGPRNERIKGD